MESTRSLEKRGWYYYHVIAMPEYWKWISEELVPSGDVILTDYWCDCSTDGTAAGNHQHKHVLIQSKVKQATLRKRMSRIRQGQHVEDRSRVKQIFCDLHLVNTIHYLRCKKGQGDHVHYNINGGAHASPCMAAKATLRGAFGVNKDEHRDCPCNKSFDAWITKMKAARQRRSNKKWDTERTEYMNNFNLPTVQRVQLIKPDNKYM